MISRFSLLKFIITRSIFPGIFFLPLLAACNNSMSDINALTAQGVQEPNVGKDVTVLYSRGGKVQARLFTHTLIRNRGCKAAVH